MKSIEEYRRAGEDLYHKLHLSTYPVAIKYIKNIDEIPEGTLRPASKGKKLSLCQAFTLSRRHGMSVAMTSDDNFCTPATAGHLWEDISAEEFIESQVLQGWHKNIEAEKIRYMTQSNNFKGQNIENLRQYMGFVSSPVNKTTVTPDSVLVYCDGLQLTHIIQALCYEYKYLPTSSFEGFGESCLKGGLIPFLTQMPQIVIPGAGDRSFAAISEHEIGVGMPGFLLFYVLENLYKTGGHMNIGYPMKSIIAMDLTEELTPGFKYMREKIDEKRRTGKED